MDWIKLEEKHKREWEKFDEFKKEALDKIEKAKNEMYAAFGDKDDNIPTTVYQKVRQNHERWEEAWGDKGYKAKYLRSIQENELKALKQLIKNRSLEYMRQGREQQKQKRKDRERDD